MTETGEGSHVGAADRDNPEALLAPVFDTVWHYRRPIKLGLAIILAGFVALVILLRLALPNEHFGSISFRVDMAGADSGEYPNGMKFTPEDIIATPVLTPVYEANDINRYGEYARYASAFLVENSSPQRDALTREYQAKLSDTRLTPVDRARLESEFAGKLNALNTPEYQLSFRQSVSGLQLPPALVNKVLHDTLRTWAQLASERKGVLSYNIPVLGRSALRWDDIAHEEFVVGADMLRSHAMRLQETLALFREKLPGADAVRVGPNQMTLEEIKASLENVRRSAIDPLSAIAAAGASNDPAFRRQYVEDQLQQARLERDEAVRRVAAVEQSMRQYSHQLVETSAAETQRAVSRLPIGRGAGETPIPQFSESFLERLMQLSSRSEDAGYRKQLTERQIDERFRAAKLENDVAYYERLRNLLGTSHAPDTRGAAVIEQRMKTAFDRLATVTVHVAGLHDQLVKNNLNPGTQLYTVTFPYTQQQVVPFTVRMAGLWGVALMIVAFFTLVIAALIYDRYHPVNWWTPRSAATAVR